MKMVLEINAKAILISVMASFESDTMPRSSLKRSRVYIVCKVTIGVEGVGKEKLLSSRPIVRPLPLLREGYRQLLSVKTA
jgi:hypothetical protein